MGNVIGITAHLQARNRLTPELAEVVKLTRKTVKEMMGLDDATEQMIKEMRRMKQAAERSAYGFNREIEKMQREIQDLKRQLGVLDSARAMPKVTIDDQARREIEAIRQEMQALNAEKARIQTGVASAGGGLATGGMVGAASAYLGAGFVDRLTLETQANARRALLGDTPEELVRYQQQAQELSLVNPNIDRTYVKDLLTQATRFGGANGTELTRQALQLSAIRPDMGGAEDFLNTQMLMKSAMPDADINRIGDSLGYVALKARDIRKDTLDSLQEYSAQMTKFIDSPEKLAMLVEAMNDVWNTDTGFDTLKEVGLKLNNVGDLENVLKTAYGAQGMADDKAAELAKKEAEQIGKYLASGSKQDRQYATGVLMQTFASIKDEFVRQNLLNELAAGPGENAGQEELVKLLQKAGEIAVIDPMVYREKMKGQLDSLYQTFQQNDPLHDFIKAKTMLSNEMTSLGVVIAQDLAPTIKWAAEGVKSFKEFLDSLPKEAAVATFVGVVGGASLALWGLVGAAKTAAQSLLSLPVEVIRKKLGGDLPDIALPDGPDKRGKGGKGGGKKRWWNPFSKVDDGLDKSQKKSLNERIEQLKDKTYVTRQEQTLRKNLFPNETGLTREEKVKVYRHEGWLGKARDALFGPDIRDMNDKKIGSTRTGWRETLKSIGGMLPDGDTVVKGAKSAWEGLKSTGGFLARKLPYIGAIIGAGQILTADDKLDMAGKVGSEALGGWGGAAAGAAIGSVVPGIGTAIGGIVGGIAGAFGGGALFDKVMSWWNDAPPTPPETPPHPRGMMKISREEVNQLRPTPPVMGPPIPPVSPVGKATEQPKSVSLTIPQLTIPLHADGVLQDVPTMLRLLDNPSVSQKVKAIIEKALIEALETRGGVAT
ncbi:hypothetical protein M4D57_18630 [Brevibacillus borstelensis]|uniref:hypothetical protein n=1 Tax=Brevibacillus borstelensis TaxID=45462 RepID=UPI00203BC85B|nr:hypothetical protein [Brevibacillus borstelensis]MCM3560585.1 hypothetical protein [Brevibacillus borstelensis]